MFERYKRKAVSLLSTTLILVLATACSEADNNTSFNGQRPNILLIVADDLGYSDIGAFGGEISTPNLDDLASQGLQATNFHTAATCSPTRAMLLSGADNHPIGLATMPGHLSTNQIGKPGYEMHLNDRAFSIADILREGGYHTYFVGKWHIGGRPEHRPNKRGFERSFALLEGGGSHFDDQLGPTSYFPKATYVEDGAEVEALPKGFFSTEYYTNKTIDYIEQDKQDNKPFFAVVAYTAPHWPLQAPAEYLDKYRGAYDKGYQVVSNQRLEKLRKLNLIDAEQEAYLQGVEDWQQLSSEQRKIESRKMEIYAAMVEHMDDNIGRLLAHLKQTGDYDNTLIVFISDNGPEGKNPINLHNNKEWIPQNFDTSYENMGKPRSFVSTGYSWAQVSALPHRNYKASIYEGGISSPMIIHHQTAELKKGIDDSFISVKDLAPTFVELAGLNHLVERGVEDGKIPMSGQSILPFLKNKTPKVHPENYAMGWEILGAYGVRKGQWKAVHTNAGWQLFNLENDRAEQNERSLTNPEKLEELIAFWDSYVQQNGIYLPTEHVGY